MHPADREQTNDDAPAGPPPPPPPRITPVVLLGLSIAMVLSLGLGAAFSRSDPAPVDVEARREAAGAVARRYLAAWERGDYGAMTALAADPPPEGVGLPLTAALEGLAVQGLRLTPGEVNLGVDVAEVTATAEFTAEVSVGGLGRWTYEGSLPLVAGSAADGTDGAVAEALPEEEAGWRVEWAPATIHPALAPGLRLTRTRTVPERAPVLAADGSALSGPDAGGSPAVRAQIVGRVAPLAEEEAAAAGPHRLAGDLAGVSGLQAAHDEQLAGRASGEVQLVDGAGTVVRVLAVFGGARPEPLRTTIDPVVQAAAEETLSAGRPAALVAIHAPTGSIRAVVSRPLGGFNRAVEGRYPPGSTFKVVTGAALLDAGVTPDDTVPCPASTVVNGRRVGNAGGESLGDIPFRTAFFRSCNTAFVRLTADRLDAASLTAAAERFGFGAEPALGLPAAGGSFPVPESPVELIVAAIGQARVTASPVHMASVAAAARTGVWQPPVLVPAAAARSDRRPLDPGVAATLRELMYLVVAEGTGTAARLPGEPVGGKTGTAEFGSRVPPRTHAWFIGFRGELAFAVLVEDAGFGGEVAAPLAADFLLRLGPGP